MQFIRDQTDIEEDWRRWSRSIRGLRRLWQAPARCRFVCTTGLSRPCRSSSRRWSRGQAPMRSGADPRGGRGQCTPICRAVSGHDRGLRPVARTAAALAVSPQAVDASGPICALEAADAIQGDDGAEGHRPWTADVYLLFCGGHPDIFPPATSRCRMPSATLSLRQAGHRQELAVSQKIWSPWRGRRAAFLGLLCPEMRREVAPVLEGYASEIPLLPLSWLHNAVTTRLI